MAGQDDRPTPRDPVPAMKAPRRHEAAPRLPIPTDDERRVQHAKDTLRRVGADRGKLPPPAPPERSRTPESGGIEARAPRIPSIVLGSLLPSSGAVPTKGDWSKLWFKFAGLGYKLAAAAVGALVLVIAALGFLWVARLNNEADALKVTQAKKVVADVDREKAWRDWAVLAAYIVDCRNDQQLRANEALLPSPEKMGAARKLEAWVDKCPTKLPPPP
jgi:hypothetical protein